MNTKITEAVPRTHVAQVRGKKYVNRLGQFRVLGKSSGNQSGTGGGENHRIDLESSGIPRSIGATQPGSFWPFTQLSMIALIEGMLRRRAESELPNFKIHMVMVAQVAIESDSLEWKNAAGLQKTREAASQQDVQIEIEATITIDSPDTGRNRIAE